MGTTAFFMRQILTEQNHASFYDTLDRCDCLILKSTFWTSSVDSVFKKKKDPIMNIPGSNTGHFKGSSGIERPELHNKKHWATQLSTKIRSLLLVYDSVMVNQSSQLYNKSTGGQKVARDTRWPVQDELCRLEFISSSFFKLDVR